VVCYLGPGGVGVEFKPVNGRPGFAARYPSLGLAVYRELEAGDTGHLMRTKYYRTPYVPW
jgi:hypothetical protein